MGRVLISIVLLFSLAGHANGQNLLDQLGKGIKRLGKNVERRIEKLDENIRNNLKPKPQVQTTTLKCIVYNAAGQKIDDEICTVTSTCQGASHCNSVFVWPSGSRTVLITQSGFAPSINDTQGYFDNTLQQFGIECVTNLDSGNRFCWAGMALAEAPALFQAPRRVEEAVKPVPREVERTAQVKPYQSPVRQQPTLPPSPQYPTVAEIEGWFARAEPLTDTANKARERCEAITRAPREVFKACEKQIAALDDKERDLRCRRAIAGSGASQEMLIKGFKASGWNKRAYPLRDVICAGAGNRPAYRFTVGNGAIPLFTVPSLQIHEGETLVLDLTFKITTPRDDRSFGKMLVDIATGENEKEVPETLVGDYIRGKAADISWNNPDNIVGCVLGFIKCE